MSNVSAQAHAYETVHNHSLALYHLISVVLYLDCKWTFPHVTLYCCCLALQPVERVIDMSYEEQKLWEEEELDKEVNFEDCKIGM